MKLVLVASLLVGAAWGQADLSGIWAPSRATGPGAPPPPTPIVQKGEYQKRYEELQAKIRAASARGEQYAVKGLCSPYGVPGMLQVASYPMEVIQTPKQVTLIGEAFSETRRVYIGRPQMPIDEVPPTWEGRSVGKWDGSTLVVDTVGIREDVPGYQNLFHSDQMRVTERFSRPKQDALHVQVTITDPVTLEKPVVYTLVYRLLPADYEMVEFVCDNNREYIDENNIVRMRIPGKK